MENNNIGDRDLKDDLLEELLVRMPIFSVFRFKCVSKRWYSIISEPSFACKYVSHATKDSKFTPRSLLLFDAQILDVSRGVNDFTPPTADSVLRRILRNGEFPLMVDRNNPPQPLSTTALFYLPPMSVKQYHAIAASNGFLLLCIDDLYYIYNFVTRETVAIPAASNLMIDPHSVGFITHTKGPFVKRFRIVQTLNQGDNIVFHVYSSEDATWSEQRFILGLLGSWDSKTPKFAFNGHLHWLDCRAGILAHDPFNENEEFRLLKFPNSISVINGLDVCLSVSKEHIRLVEIPTSEAEFAEAGWICRMWRLEDYDKEEWCLEHKVTHDWSPIIETASTCLIPLLCDPHNAEVVYFCHLVDGEVISFNLRTKDVCIDNNWEPYHHQFGIKVVLPAEIPIWPSPIPRPDPKRNTCT